MKFRPNQTLNRQNFVCNLIQIAETSNKPSSNDLVDSDMKNTTSNNNNNSNNNSLCLNSVTGLNNLGNTCFFNSILQNLAQTPFLDELLADALKTQNSQFTIKHNDDYDSELTDYEEIETIKNNINKQKKDILSSSEDENEDEEEEETKKENKTDNKKLNNSKHVYHRSIKVDDLNLILKEPNGVLTSHLLNTIKSITNPTCAIVNPSTLFGSLCKKVPTFKGFQQHDSHELLRNLLDTVKTEELKRRQTVILEHFEASKAINHLTDLDKKKIKRYGRLSSYTLIDKLFGGHLLSTIVCDECKNCLQRVEPFLDLSLPIVDDSNKSIVSIASAAASTTFSLTSNKLKHLSNKKLAKIHHEGKMNIDQYLKDEDEKSITKNQAKKQKKMAKKAKKGRSKRRNESESEEEPDKENIKKEDEKENENENKESDIIKEDVVQNEQSQNCDLLPETTKIEMLIQPLETLQINNKSNDRNDLKNEFKLEAMKSCSNLTSTSITDILLSESSSIQSCLSKFTSKEVLSDKLHCEKCSKKNSTKTYTRSMKQYLICELPAILTIHLKRFQQHGMRLEKLNKNVNFPLILDMSPYTSTQAVNKSSHKIFYSLYGVVEHSGKLNSGHYVAYVKAGQQTGKNNGRKFLGQHRLCHLNKMFQFYLNNSSSEENDVKNETINDINDHSNDKWFYVSDSQVNEVTVSRVLKCQAYILFYERIQ